MNTCPVYRRSGGYSYNYVIPGPIGSVLAPHRGIKKYKSLPFACTHCGSCDDVCPVKIDLHEQILEWRAEVDMSGNLGFVKKSAMVMATIVLGNALLFALGGKLARMIFRILPKPICNFITIWGKTRDFPDIPANSFREVYNERVINGTDNGK
jgi:L-lactate dehydrogenase complex protein LldF